ncbi:MAG: ATP-binding protein [Planctomycetales bacterium]
MRKKPPLNPPTSTSSKLPINLEDLLRQRTVEQDRIEYKAGWNPDPIIRTLCAFANDFENLGGGYVVIGQDCDEAGQPIFPPIGVPDNQLDKIQRELLQYGNLIQPPYFPVLSIEQFAGKNLVVLWAPGGQTRPYSAPKEVTAKHRTQHYYIRRYSSTVEAKGEDQRELLSLTATVPFDDRMCRAAAIDDLSLPLIRAFLKEIGSGLYQQRGKASLVELARLMNIVDGADESVKPRNVGILFFSDTPEKFLPGTQIDVVIFPQGAGGDEIVEKILHGPIHQQIRDALRYIRNNVVVEKVLKHPDRAEATRFFNYPMAAIEEALVNAMYHRGYDQREPVEVRVNPDGIEIVSYPGPDPSIRSTDLKAKRIVSRRYRNRRIGEFFKELEMTEGRGTGIPKIRAAMKRNGSPRPKFTTDDLRTWFLAELPVHPEFAGEAAPPVAEQVGTKLALSRHQVDILAKCREETGLVELMTITGRKDRTKFRQQVFNPLLDEMLIEMTIPDKPRSSKQQYRLTPVGRAVLDARGDDS